MVKHFKANDGHDEYIMTCEPQAVSIQNTNTSETHVIFVQSHLAFYIAIQYEYHRTTNVFHHRVCDGDLR